MKFDLDEFSFKDEINFMNLNNQMKNQELKINNLSFGFNEDTIYRNVEKNKE